MHQRVPLCVCTNFTGSKGGSEVTFLCGEEAGVREWINKQRRLLLVPHFNLTVNMTMVNP